MLLRERMSYCASVCRRIARAHVVALREPMSSYYASACRGITRAHVAVLREHMSQYYASICRGITRALHLLLLCISSNSHDVRTCLFVLLLFDGTPPLIKAWYKKRFSNLYSGSMSPTYY